MKKLLLTTAVILGLTFSANAQEPEVPQQAEEETEAVVTQEPEFEKIDKAVLPQAVKDAVMNDLDGMAIQEAYVTADEEETKMYKLVVAATTADTTVPSKTLYADAEGNWLKPEDLNVGE